MKKRVAFSVVCILFALGIVAELPVVSTIEGSVRSVDPDLLRVAVETSSGELVAAFGTFDTPVLWDGQTYRITNLEVGDRIRMEVSGTGEDGRISSITVLDSVSANKPDDVPAPTEPASTPPPPVEILRTPEPSTGTTVAAFIGRIDHKRPDRNLFRIITDGGLNWIRVDASNAHSPEGVLIRVQDLVFGETVEVSGHMGENGELIATVVRREAYDLFEPEADEYEYDEPVVEPATVPEPVPAYEPEPTGWLDVVRFEGEVVGTIRGQKIRIRNDITRQIETIWCDSDFVVLLDDDPIPAEDLEDGMRVEIRALRTTEGLIAQSILAEED